MTWEQKIQAAQALGPELSLKMRAPGSWYISQYVERKEGATEVSVRGHFGTTPEDAASQYWDWLTDPKFYVVITAYPDKRKAVRWNGYMWADVDEKAVAAA